MNKTEQLARYFQKRPNQWISAITLMQQFGLLSSRTRISECRQPPFNMRIDNRCRVVKAKYGHTKISEYRYSVPQPVPLIFAGD